MAIKVSNTTVIDDGRNVSAGILTATSLNVTGVSSAVSIRNANTLVGTASTINFGTSLQVTAVSSGIVTVNNSRIDINTQTVGYALTTADAGKYVSVPGVGVTVLANIFSAGDIISIVNTVGTATTITAGTNVTLRLGGTSLTGNRFLAGYGLATVLCTASSSGFSTFIVAGAGLT
jgi:hypothetical protein